MKLKDKYRFRVSAMLFYIFTLSLKGIYPAAHSTVYFLRKIFAEAWTRTEDSYKRFSKWNIIFFL